VAARPKAGHDGGGVGPSLVMAGLGPAIHDFAGAGEGVDARPKAGHDGQ